MRGLPCPLPDVGIDEEQENGHQGETGVDETDHHDRLFGTHAHGHQTVVEVGLIGLIRGLAVFDATVNHQDIVEDGNP